MRISFNNSNQQKIVGILEQPNKKTNYIVILVHGYTSNKDRRIKEIAEKLTKHNINSLRIDLDGCGESEGEFENQTISSAVDDILSAIEFVKARHYEKISLLGSSAGGLAAMAAALRYPLHKLALKAPVSDYLIQMMNKYGEKYIDDWKKKGYHFRENSKGVKLKVNYSFFQDAKNHMMYDKVKKVKCPVLIIHGTNDESVNLKDSEHLAKGFPNAKLIVLKGADHSLSIKNDRTESNKLFVDFLKK